MSAPNQLSDFASPALVQALGWTLLHSLWQGAVLALGASLLLMLLHRHVAAVRYRVSAVALLLLLTLAGGTFGYYYQAAGARAVVPAGVSAVARVSVVPGAAPEAAFDQAPTTAYQVSASQTAPSRQAAWLRTALLYFEQNLPLLVACWLLGMLAMTLRFLGGLAYVQRLQRYRVAALPEGWQARLDALAQRAGLRQRVRLLASALVPGPLVVGWLRPIILLPLSAATGLTDTELEAILAHELAHVRRHDYLFNLVQALAEILFFYHPAVWFLSASLRTERENCCDDLATELCGDPVVLARALASLAALSLAPELAAPRLALAAAGVPNSLLGRVRRLVRHRAEVPTFLEGFGAACVVLAGIVVLVFSTVASLNASPARMANSYPRATSSKAGREGQGRTAARLPVPASAAPGAGDTIFVSAETNARLLSKSGRTRLSDIQGLTVVVQDAAGNVREVYADGRKVPATELPAYRAALARSAAHHEAAATAAGLPDARTQRMSETAQRMAQQALAGDSVSDDDAESLSDDALAMADFNAALATSGLESEAQNNAKALRARNISLRQQLQRLKVQPNSAASNQQRQLLTKKLAEVQAQWERVRQRLNADLARQVAEVERQAMASDIDHQGPDNAEGSGPDDALAAEMYRDGLITDPDNYEFSLSRKELTINSRKQSASVLQKYNQRYTKLYGRPLTATGSYSVTHAGAGIGIDTNDGRTSRRGRNLRSRMALVPPVPSVPPVPPVPSVPPVPPLPPVPSVPPVPTVPPVPPAGPGVDEIRAQLRRDGLIDANEKSFSLNWRDGRLTVNGQPQSAARAARYRQLFGLRNRPGQSYNIVVTDR